VRKYECIVVLHPGTPEADTTGILTRFEETVNRHGGEVRKKDVWGNRRLAYPIENQSTGNYFFYQFNADNTLVDEADRAFRLEERVLRHLIVVDEEWEERNRPSLARRAARMATRETVEDVEEEESE
jgi:small subunit ribosomal protein S6